MSDIEKPVEEVPTATSSAAAAAHGATATQSKKPPTFLDKLSLFTIGKNRGQLPPAKGTLFHLVSYFPTRSECYCGECGQLQTPSQPDYVSLLQYGLKNEESLTDKKKM